MRRLKNEEQGAIAVVVAICLLVLIGAGAFAVDMGNLYWERRQLQNAADAGAMAAAQEIVLSGTSNPYTVAREYAAANSGRGAHVAFADFELIPNATSPEIVRVTTRTGSYEELGTLPSILAGVFEVFDYETEATAAVRLHENIGGGKTIPIAICVENWNHWTSDGTSFPTEPYVVSFATPKGQQDPENAECGNPGSEENETYPGGFGFLDRDADCKALTDASDESLFLGKPGDNINWKCQSDLAPL
jgi:hypothetical protein